MAIDEETETETETEAEMENQFGKRGCCFWVTCGGGGGGAAAAWWERIRTADHHHHHHHHEEERWWRRGWRKVREWSEIAAGPKWKTFIRRFNNHAPNCNAKGKFHYDPLSYSLNFDHGAYQNGTLEEDLVFRDFSSRYAAIPISAKSSMDLGKDAPSFI
ncbi:hypothetical protein Scep_017742 [Stephania cephalantha]|uniref:NHL domain-containing protein n=1 Tax=Stephania cephalantha TaxID=152367 RepID=A0AAP0NV80_9MAGN